MDSSAFLSVAENVIQISLIAVLLSSFIAIFVYIIFKYVFKTEDIWRNISLVGTFILVTAQLIGAFSSVTFPIMLGPDVSDYSISCYPVDLEIVIPDSLINERIAAKLNRTSKMHLIYNIYTFNISVNNLNPLRKYDKQIHLMVSNSPEFITNIVSPVLKIDQSSELRIGVNLNDLHTGSKYLMVIQATGADGKKRNCTISVRAISEYEANPTMSLNNRGVELFNQSMYDESIEYFDRAIKIDPENATAWLNKGAALAKLGRCNESLSALNKAIESDQNYANAWFNGSVPYLL